MAGPDIQIRGGGGGGRGSHPDPDKRGGLVSEKVFSALRTSVWSKKRGGPGTPRAPPLDPPLKTQLKE